MKNVQVHIVGSSRSGKTTLLKEIVSKCSELIEKMKKNGVNVEVLEQHDVPKRFDLETVYTDGVNTGIIVGECYSDPMCLFMELLDDEGDLTDVYTTVDFGRITMLGK